MLLKAVSGHWSKVIIFFEYKIIDSLKNIIIDISTEIYIFVI